MVNGNGKGKAKPGRRGRARHHLTGQSFNDGHFKVTRMLPPRKGEVKTRCSCLCRCGVRFIAVASDVALGHTKSCRACTRERLVKAGESRFDAETRKQIAADVFAGLTPKQIAAKHGISKSRMYAMVPVAEIRAAAAGRPIARE